METGVERFLSCDEDGGARAVNGTQQGVGR